MRLRYLHLPRCGPLTDIAVVFGREDRIAKTLDLYRKGSLNFVVGVNGSGKSFLLRAIYGVFRSLYNREWPALPITLAWDRKTESKNVTALFHYTGKRSESFFAILKPVPGNTRRHEWLEIVTRLGEEGIREIVEGEKPVVGSEVVKSSILAANLPKHLIAYTSGATAPWEQIDIPIFDPKDEEEGQFEFEDERPQGWCLDRELEAGLVPTEDTRHKILTNRMARHDWLEKPFSLIESQDLRFAGIVLGLWQAAKELSGCSEDRQKEALRNYFIHQRDSDVKPQDARRVLNEIDWFCPTHLSLTYHSDEDRTSLRQHLELFCLVALADEVISQPLARQRIVFSLGPSDNISLKEKIDHLELTDNRLEEVASRVEGSKSGAEAFLRIFSEDREIDSTPMDVFSRLRDWKRNGLLEDITLTVKRLHRSVNANQYEEGDDVIVTYDQLSDGEQMLLGRMGLIFLLRGQDGSLLLLDEPETHFNDVWKREIVEMVDMGLLNSTSANVIVATHTSIALTDAFAAEVTVLDRHKGEITARGVTGGLFGTDPGEVTMNLFRAESSVGRRSVELLDRLLNTEWRGRENDLEMIMDTLGSSFHRAELRAILKRLKADIDGSSSR